jgi:hypothetical protein
MNDQQRRALLRDLSRIGSAAEYADSTSTFLPLPAHEAALRADTLVVRGERGAGKTALFAFVNSADEATLARLFPTARLADTTWIDGFSEHIDHPQAHVLENYGRQAQPSDLRLVWLMNLARAVARHSPALKSSLPPVFADIVEGDPNDPAKWVATATSNLPALASYLDGVERQLASEKRTIVVAYDYLDRIGVLSERNVRESFTGSLLAMWASFSGRYRHLRAKVFVREDLFEASTRAFPDASKLESRSVSLSWSRESLYRVLIRQIASQSEPLRDWLKPAIPLEQDPLLGFLPPTSLPETGRVSQKAFADRLAGETMGSGTNKGFTYRWILNHLQDAHKRVVPRSLVNLIGIAASRASLGPEASGSTQLLHPKELSGALEDTSKRRVAELREEHDVVKRMAALQGLTVLLERRLVVRMLDEDGGDGDAVFRELAHLGILSIRADGRVDVPDLYRYGYSIKRKGGVARPR